MACVLLKNVVGRSCFFSVRNALSLLSILCPGRHLCYLSHRCLDPSMGSGGVGEGRNSAYSAPGGLIPVLTNSQTDMMGSFHGLQDTYLLQRQFPAPEKQKTTQLQYPRFTHLLPPSPVLATHQGAEHGLCGLLEILHGLVQVPPATRKWFFSDARSKMPSAQLHISGDFRRRTPGALDLQSHSHWHT